MNYIFIGGTYRGFKLFEHLISIGYKPSLTFILIEDEHEQLVYSPLIAALCEAHQIPFALRKKLSANDELEIKKNRYAFAIVCGWRTLINPELSTNFEYGLVAAHDSLLPQYRGFAPLNWSIINGEKKTGVTLFIINEGEVDSGEVVGQEAVIIEHTEYAIDVYEKIIQTTLRLYTRFIEQYKSNEIKKSIQDETGATYTCKRLPVDGRINWKNNSVEIYNLIRGLAHPYPGSFFFLNGKEYFVRTAKLGKNNHKEFIGKIAGRVLSSTTEGVEVLCNSGTILLMEVEDKVTNKVFMFNNIVKSINTTLS